MKLVKFTVNNITYEVKATSLHTALHRLGEALELKGYNLSVSSYDCRNTLSIVMRNNDIKQIFKVNCTPTVQVRK